MTNFIQVTPFLHVADLQEALDFFTDILGFTVPFRQPGYAYIHRETVGFRLLEAESRVVAPGHRRFAYYIDVRDVDALYAELKPKLDTLPPEHVHGPADKTYGQRELLVLAPDGELICFGMAMPQAEVAKA
ncbi:MAG TPA: VOC family protein [Brevundimonas sp.]|uniref:bleomycin resistance protein n=1 Tax=Brevundimonas sp. TaxID=1871086 RepID=UPI002ED88F24